MLLTNYLFVLLKRFQKLFQDEIKQHNKVYLFSLLKYSEGLIGNSSSGIIEIPSLKVATINIGNRQLGRAKGETIIDCASTEKEIENAFPASRNEYNRLCDRKLRGYTYSGDSSLSTPLSCNIPVSETICFLSKWSFSDR